MNTTHPTLTAVVELARLAPSVHNTQPWQFSADGDVLTLRRDESRRLGALDPDGRQQTISCGTAVHLARLGFRLQGFDPTVEVVRADGRSLVVRFRGVPGPGPSSSELAQGEAARSRHTQRGRFDGEPVTADEVAALREAAQTQGAWVRFLESPSDQAPLAVLLSRADEEEQDDEAYRAELATWTNRPKGAGDGVPADAATLGTEPRTSGLRLREFVPAPHVAAAGSEAPAPERPLVAVLGTPGDSAADWLLAGQAMSAMLLRATMAGVQASPLGQVLDRPWARRRLAGELGVVGHPQMVLRLGHARPGPATPRRALDDLLA